MKSRLRHFVDSTTKEDLGWALQVICPGCLQLGGSGLHQMGVSGSWGKAYGKEFQWDGNLDIPTISPSIAISTDDGMICHSFLGGGVWQFLSDSIHPLTRQIVPMLDLPDWLVTEHD